MTALEYSQLVSLFLGCCTAMAFVLAAGGSLMVSLPAGFSASDLVADFSALGVYIVSAYVIIMCFNIVVSWLGGKR